MISFINNALKPMIATVVTVIEKVSILRDTLQHVGNWLSVLIGSIKGVREQFHRFVDDCATMIDALGWVINKVDDLIEKLLEIPTEITTNVRVRTTGGGGAEPLPGPEPGPSPGPGPIAIKAATYPLYGPMPKLQHGGIIVGEAGPEAVIPLDKAGIGSDIHLHVNFNEPIFMENEGSMNKLADKLRKVLRQQMRLEFGEAMW